MRVVAQRFFKKFLPCALATAALVMAGGCSKPADPKADVILLHSGRIRGNVYPLELQGLAPLQHYQYLAGYVRQVREEAAKTGARVVLVDLGDSLGGSFASHVTGSMNMVSFFNETGYDAVMLSNLDGEVPQEAIAALKAKVLNPFLGPEGQPAVEGTSAGARIPVEGLPLYLLANFYGDADPAGKQSRFPARFGAFAGGVRPVRDYAAVLKSLGERPSGALTLMGWMKFEQVDVPPEPLLGSLRTLGVDAILAHRTYAGSEREAWQASGFVDWKPPVSVNILRNNGGFVIARMDLARDGAKWRVLKHELVPVTSNRAPSDAAVTKAIAPYAPAIQAADKAVAKLPQAVSQEEIFDIYFKALTQIPGTQAVAYSPESIRTDWSAGDLRASAVFNSLPWTSGLVQIPVPRDRLVPLAKSAQLRIAVAPGDSDPVVVTTSRFFGSLIAPDLGLPESALVGLPQTSEFDFFAGYLASQKDLFPATLPDGWEVLTP